MRFSSSLAERSIEVFHLFCRVFASFLFEDLRPCQRRSSSSRWAGQIFAPHYGVDDNGLACQDSGQILGLETIATLCELLFGSSQVPLRNPSLLCCALLLFARSLSNPSTKKEQHKNTRPRNGFFN